MEKIRVIFGTLKTTDCQFRDAANCSGRWCRRSQAGCNHTCRGVRFVFLSKRWVWWRNADTVPVAIVNLFVNFKNYRNCWFYILFCDVSCTWLVCLGFESSNPKQHLTILNNYIILYGGFLKWGYIPLNHSFSINFGVPPFMEKFHVLVHVIDWLGWNFPIRDAFAINRSKCGQFESCFPWYGQSIEIGRVDKTQSPGPKNRVLNQNQMLIPL